MADRLPSKCTDPTCFNIGNFHATGGRCHQHLRQNERDRKRVKGPTYGANWDRFKKSFDAVGNTICQRIGPCAGEREIDVRCRRPVYYHHHIVDPVDRPTLAYDWRNVVGVCESCHPRPSDKDQGRFVPSLWRTPMSDEPLPAMVHPPGQKVPRDAEIWTLANRLELFS